MSKEISRDDIRVGDKIKVTEVFTVTSVDKSPVDGNSYLRYTDGPNGSGTFYLAPESKIKLLERKTTIPEDAEFITWNDGYDNYAKRIRVQSLDGAYDGVDWVDDACMTYTEEDFIQMLEHDAGGKFTVLKRAEEA